MSGIHTRHSYVVGADAIKTKPINFGILYIELHICSVLNCWTGMCVYSQALLMTRFTEDGKGSSGSSLLFGIW